MNFPTLARGMLAGGVIRETIIIGSKTAFQISISEARFTIRGDIVRYREVMILFLENQDQ